MTKKPEDIKQEDQNLEDYLKGDSPLSRIYRAEEKKQPPSHLDNTILSAANKAIRSEQKSNIAYSPFARTWYVPASMVAVLVLCVGVVFTIYQNSGETLLTAPKSEYDYDVQIVPLVTEPAEPATSEGSRVAGEKYRQLEYADEVQDEAELSVDVISEENRPVPPSIDSYGVEKSEVQQQPARKTILREKSSGIDETSLPGTTPALTDEIVPMKNASEQMMSDSPHKQERGDISGRLEAADIKKQKQLDINSLNNEAGEMELKVFEQDTGADQESHYWQAVEDQLKQDDSLSKEIVNKEILDNDKAAGGIISPEKSTGNEVITPERWLEQINNLWISGDQQNARHNLTLFFETYPDYPIENAKAILDPQIDLLEYINTK